MKICKSRKDQLIAHIFYRDIFQLVRKHFINSPEKMVSDLTGKER